jgi:hypothetical protein
VTQASHITLLKNKKVEIFRSFVVIKFTQVMCNVRVGQNCGSICIFKLPYHKTVGRPRTRWADVVKRDVQLMEIRGRRRRAASKDEWRHLMK